MGRQNQLRILRNGKIAAFVLGIVAVVFLQRNVRIREESFTVMTMTYLPRSGLLQDFIDSYIECPGVRSILVVWNGEGSESVAHLTGSRVKLRVEALPSMNNRYKPDEYLRDTPAVLSLDDDLRIPCHTLQAAFVSGSLPQSL